MVWRSNLLPPSALQVGRWKHPIVECSVAQLLTPRPNTDTDLKSTLLLLTEMQKVGDKGDISLLLFLAGANFWTILGHFWALLHLWLLSH